MINYIGTIEEESEALLAASMERFNELAQDKYRKGQSEHGGLLTDRDCLDELEKEIIDSWFYVQAEKARRAKVSDMLVEVTKKVEGLLINAKNQQQADK